MKWSECKDTGDPCRCPLKYWSFLSSGFLSWDTKLLHAEHLSGLLCFIQWDLDAGGIETNMRLLLPAGPRVRTPLCPWPRSPMSSQHPWNSGRQTYWLASGIKKKISDSSQVLTILAMGMKCWQRHGFLEEESSRALCRTGWEIWDTPWGLGANALIKVMGKSRGGVQVPFLYLSMRLRAKIEARCPNGVWLFSSEREEEEMWFWQCNSKPTAAARQSRYPQIRTYWCQ